MGRQLLELGQPLIHYKRGNVNLKTWVLNSDSGLSKDDLRRFESFLRQMVNKTEKQAIQCVKDGRRRHMIKEYAYRVMFKGHRYPEGHKRPSDTLPVWVDPDE